MQLSTVHGKIFICYLFCLLVHTQCAVTSTLHGSVLDFDLTVSTTLSQEATLTSQVHHPLMSSCHVFCFCGVSLCLCTLYYLVFVTTRLFVCTLSTDQRSEETRTSTAYQRRNVSCFCLFKTTRTTGEEAATQICCPSLILTSHGVPLKDCDFC